MKCPDEPINDGIVERNITECVERFDCERVLYALLTFPNWTKPDTSEQELKDLGRYLLREAWKSMGDDSESSCATGCLRALVFRSGAMKLECCIADSTNDVWIKEEGDAAEEIEV